MKHTSILITLYSILCLGWQIILPAQTMPQDNWYLEREFTAGAIGGLNSPRGLSFGPDGKIFICERIKDRVQILDSNGSLLKVVSGIDDPIDSVFAGGKLYVTGYDSRYVKVYDINGTFLFNVGSYGSGNGQFDRPYGIAADYNGSNLEIFVSDTGRDRIQVFSEIGTFLRKFSTVNVDPREIAIGSDGLVYVADKSDLVNVFTKTGTKLSTISGITGEPYGVSVHGNRIAIGNSSTVHKVRIYDTNGSFIKEFGDLGTANGEFNYPQSVDYDSSGNLWVADSSNHRIQIFDGNGTYIRQFGEYAESPNLSSPSAFVLDSQGNHYVSDTGNHRVVVLDATGNYVRSIASSGSDIGKVTSPKGIALDSANRIYVADSGNDRVQVFENNGTFIRSFGSTSIFSEPWGVAVNNQGIVFVSDYSQHKIHVFDPAGNLTGSWGENGSLNHQLKNPCGLAIGPEGDLYVADSVNYSIKRFTPTGSLVMKVDLRQRGGNTRTDSRGARPQTVGIRQDGLIVTAARNDGWTDFWVLDNAGNRLIKNSHYTATTGRVAINQNGTFTWMIPNIRLFKTYQSSYRAGPLGQDDGIPYPALLNVSQAFGSTNLEVSYKVTDLDSPTVTTGILGFKNGNDSLSSVIIPESLVGNTSGQLGANIDVNQSKSITWDLASDWNGTVGSIAVEVLAKDDRDLLDLHFVEIPADSSNSTALTINRFPLTNEDLKSAWYWLLATGDSGIKLDRGIVCEPSFDFTPVSPSTLSGKLLWLDANDINGNGQPNTEANGTKVEVWTDKSGNENNATQATEASQPTYKTNAQNGLSTLFFDASDDAMATGINLARPYTIMAVFNNLDTGGEDRQAVAGSGNLIFGVWDGKVGFYKDDWISRTVTRVKSTYYVAVAQSDSSTSAFFLDGTDRTTNSTPRGSPGAIYLGKGGNQNKPLNGHIGEVLIFDRFLNEVDRSKMEWYLGQKWGVSGTSPSGSGVYANDSGTTDSGKEYLLGKMNLRVATQAEKTRALEATTPGVVNQFTPDFQVQPSGSPEKINEFGIETTRNGTWVVPN